MANIGLVAMLAGLLFLFPPAVSSQEMPPGRWWRDPGVIQRLGLSGQEIERLEQAYLESKRRLIQNKGDLEAERFELEALFGKNNFNENAAIQQHDKLEQKRTALAQSRFQFVLEARKILGPERFQKLADLYQQAPPRPLPSRKKPGPFN